jgi:PhzF family phenazine biosynthesis protein
MNQHIVQVDAFTAEPFRGNPAAVCIMAAAAGVDWMRAVAREMNLSETAFLHPESDGWRLRWFTPATEVDLCGHATLASAHVLWEEKHLSEGQTARFHTRSGLLGAARDGEWIVLDFPATPPSPAAAPAGLLGALGLETARSVGRSRFDYLVEVDAAETVRRLEPDFGALRRVEARGIIVTAPSDDTAYDFVSRFFAPAVGVDEDPVTGSAHCALAPFWAVRLGRSDLRGYQASARGGLVRTAWSGDRVRLGGQAVTVLRGALLSNEKAQEWQ